jgi:hypothetical protein
MGAIAPLAAAQGIEKILVAVIADASVFVGRDVGRVERPERQRNRQAPRMVGTARCGVADKTIGRPREIFAAFDLIGIDGILGNAGRIGRGVIGERNRPAAGERRITSLS